MWRTLELAGADLRFDPHFLADGEAAEAFAALRDSLPWSVHRIRLFGREVDSPRLSAWLGEPGASYRYSGTRFEPHPWTPALRALRDRVAVAAGVEFNSVLANRYRSGADHMGWHSDDEPELGPEPVIASLSLGATRRFRLRHRRGDPALAIDLPPGSLLVMRGQTQRLYRHALPRTARPVGERLNLTFRWIRPVPAGAGRQGRA